MSKTQQCLLIGQTGFLGRRITEHLATAQVAVIGTSTGRAGGQIETSIPYRFPVDDIRGNLTERAFDTVIVAARLANPALYQATGLEGEDALERFAADVQSLFASLDQPDQRGVSPHIIYISSDAVFSGEKGGYSEDDPPDAETLYGRMHAAAEAALQAQTKHFTIVRTSFLFDLGDIPADKRLSNLFDKLSSGQEVHADVNVFKSPVAVSDAARAITTYALEQKAGIQHLSAPRKSVFGFFDNAVEAHGFSRYRKQLIERESGQFSDTSLRSSDA